MWSWLPPSKKLQCPERSPQWSAGSANLLLGSGSLTRSLEREAGHGIGAAACGPTALLAAALRSGCGLHAFPAGLPSTASLGYFLPPGQSLGP